MSTNTYTVVGMHCGGCVSSITEEVGAVPGVSEVSVDLATGRLTVSSEPPVGTAAVRGAVEEAGYQLAAQ